MSRHPHPASPWKGEGKAAHLAFGKGGLQAVRSPRHGATTPRYLPRGNRLLSPLSRKQEALTQAMVNEGWHGDRPRRSYGSVTEATRESGVRAGGSGDDTPQDSASLAAPTGGALGHGDADRRVVEFDSYSGPAAGDLPPAGHLTAKPTSSPPTRRLFLVPHRFI